LGEHLKAAVGVAGMLRRRWTFLGYDGDEQHRAGGFLLGGSVQQARIAKRVAPRYPPLARQARIQGVVKLTAIIARDGSVDKLEVSSGHPLLVPAALEAVKEWQYKPTLLNGEAVEVVTQVDVIFKLTG